MKPLLKKIVGQIKEKGPLTFEQFMTIALYDAEYGYYNTESRKIGREGDFYTSPYLHPVFGAVMARQMQEMWEKMRQPDHFRIIEMGAGTGYFCKDVLTSLNGTAFFSSLRYSIIEQSPAMRDLQQQLLGEFTGKVDWMPALQECAPMTGCIFSNELLDAFPVHLVRMEDTLREIYLDYDDEKGLFEKTGGLSSSEISDYFIEFHIKLAKGYTTEVNLRIKDWLNDINTVLQKGFIMTVDYGFPAWDYYSEDRDRGTLLCYHKHQLIENPYVNIGEQDITAHVNYSAVKKWGADIGIETAGYCGQGVFMVSLGVDDDIKKIAEGAGDYVFEIARIKKLILPQGMGESHKVMVQYKGIDAPKLRGFSIRNQIKSL